MCWAFERLRVVREYRSPRTIRSFTKVFISLMPLLLSPYYVFIGKHTGNHWAAYYVAIIVSFVFGTLQGVQDKLDDPFDGISEDDINLGQVRVCCDLRTCSNNISMLSNIWPFFFHPYSDIYSYHILLYK